MTAKENRRNLVMSVYETTLIVNIAPIKSLAQESNILDSQEPPWK